MSDLPNETSCPSAGAAPMSPTATGLHLFGITCLIASLIVGVALTPAPVAGAAWRPVHYLPVLVWLMTGLIEAALCLAIGQSLAYLDRLLPTTPAAPSPVR